MCILLGLGGEHHVNIDDFRWFCFDWIWLWWLYWIQLKFVNSVPYDGFSRPREVVKPRRKAKNLVFGHPWHPPNSTTFVFFVVGLQKTQGFTWGIQAVRGSKQNLQRCNSNPAFCEISPPQKKWVACHFKHRNALTTLGLWKWFRLNWVIQRASDNNAKALEKQWVVPMLLLGLKWRVWNFIEHHVHSTLTNLLCWKKHQLMT